MVHMDVVAEYIGSESAVCCEWEYRVNKLWRDDYTGDKRGSEALISHKKPPKNKGGKKFLTRIGRARRYPGMFDSTVVTRSGRDLGCTYVRWRYSKRFTDRMLKKGALGKEYELRRGRLEKIVSYTDLSRSMLNKKTRHRRIMSIIHTGSKHCCDRNVTYVMEQIYSSNEEAIKEVRKRSRPRKIRTNPLHEVVIVPEEPPIPKFDENTEAYAARVRGKGWLVSASRTDTKVWISGMDEPLYLTRDDYSKPGGLGTPNYVGEFHIY
jgi:hypothetical protein